MSFMRVKTPQTPIRLSKEPIINEANGNDRVRRRLEESFIKRLGELVKKHPEQAVSILRGWMHKGN